MLKHCVIVGGPNGAGKSTFAYEYLTVHRYEYVCADEFAKQINPEKPEAASVAAGRMFLTRVRELIEAGENLLIESTLSGKSLIRTIEQARQAGYEITIVFVFVASDDVCVDRVAHRKRMGGHHVPELDVRRRFGRAVVNFWHRYRPVADRWHLFYNSGSHLQFVAKGSPERTVVEEEDVLRVFERMIDAANDQR